MNIVQESINAVAVAPPYLIVMLSLTAVVVGLLLIAVFRSPSPMSETRVIVCIAPKFYVKIVAGI